MSKTVDDFVQELSTIGLMAAGDVETFVAGLSAQPQDAESFAKSLVRAGKLTKYQAASVYQGKGKSLVFGDYVVLDKIGAGGMGVVLKAQHRRMKRMVAVKILPAKAMDSETAVQRFYREVEAAAKLIHSNIVTAFDAGEHRGMHYLVMEFVDGKDLSQILIESGPLPIEQAVECVIQAARGLEYAHSNGIVHRDIKPANLLLTKDGTIKILDMGLARLTEQVGQHDETEDGQLTKSGQIMGTTDYMSPEQAMDTRTADHRADIYALGCTLFRLLTGKSVYEADTVMKRLMAHQQAEIPSLCDKRPDVPAALELIFRRMVAKEPAERQQSMTELGEDLQAMLLPAQATARRISDDSSSDSALSDFFANLNDDKQRVATEKKTQQSTAVNDETLAYKADIEETGDRLPQVGAGAHEPAQKPQVERHTKVLAKKELAQRGSQKKLFWLASIGGPLCVAILLVIAMLIVQSPTRRDEPPPQTAPPAGETVGKSVVFSGTPSYALEFDGQRSRVELPIGHKDQTPLTFEAFVMFDPVYRTDLTPGAIVANNESSGLSLNVGKQQFQFLMSTDVESNYLRAVSENLPVVDEPVHVAGVFDGRQIKLFVAGELTATSELAGEYIPSPYNLMIGASADPVGYDNPFRGTIDEVRISSVARYAEDFTPLQLDERFEVDDDTLALYHFDEGPGSTIARDATGKHDGTIQNCEYVPVERRYLSGNDREVAEWVLSLGGGLSGHIDGKAISTKKLPANGEVSLHSISLGGKGQFVSDTDLARIGTLKELRMLGIPGSRITDDGMRHLASLPSLTRLDVYSTDISDQALQHLSSLNNLTMLHLRDTKVTNAGLKHLTSLAKLETLIVDKTKVNADGVAELQKALPYCNIRWDGGLDGTLDRDRKAAEWIVSVGGSVRVSTAQGAGDLISAPEKVPTEPFQVLDVVLTKTDEISVEDFDLLAGLGECNSLDLSRIDDDCLNRISGTNISGALNVNDKFTDKAITNLATRNDISRIRQLRINSTNLTGESLSNISARSFTQLWLRSPSLTDDALRHLSGWEADWLSLLSAAKISDAGIKHVAQMKRVHFLQLSGTSVTNTGLADLCRSRPELSILELDETQVTDEGLVHLAQLRQLEEVSLLKTKVTETGVAKVKKLLPSACIVKWDGDPDGSPAGRPTISVKVTPKESLDTGDAAWSVAFSPGKGQFLAAGNSKSVLRIWDLNDVKRPRLVVLNPDEASTIETLRFSPDGKWLAAATNSSVFVIDVETDEFIEQLEGANAAVWSPDGALIAAGWYGATFQVYDTQTWQPRFTIQQTGTRELEFADNGQTLIAASDTEIRWWNMTDGNELHVLPHGRRMALSSSGLLAVEWERELIQFFEQPNTPPLYFAKPEQDLTRMVFSPVGRVLAAGYMYGPNAVDLFDATTGLQVARIDHPTKPIYDIAFTSDGKQLATACEDGKVRLFDVDVSPVE
jgi:serine/threonine protein kinase/WD40 repeat protein